MHLPTISFQIAFAKPFLRYVCGQPLIGDLDTPTASIPTPIREPVREPAPLYSSSPPNLDRNESSDR